jgi:cyclin-dependent kinase-like
MHSNEVMHRDLKPANIMVKDRSLLKICDFGHARTFAEINKENEAEPTEIKSKFSTGVGTPVYKAPEMYSGDYDERVDLYAVGGILMEFLCPERWLTNQDF